MDSATGRGCLLSRSTSLATQVPLLTWFRNMVHDNLGLGPSSTRIEPKWLRISGDDDDDDDDDDADDDADDADDD